MRNWPFEVSSKTYALMLFKAWCWGMLSVSVTKFWVSLNLLHSLELGFGRTWSICATKPRVSFKEALSLKPLCFLEIKVRGPWTVLATMHNIYAPSSIDHNSHPQSHLLPQTLLGPWPIKAPHHAWFAHPLVAIACHEWCPTWRSPSTILRPLTYSLDEGSITKPKPRIPHITPQSLA